MTIFTKQLTDFTSKDNTKHIEYEYGFAIISTSSRSLINITKKSNINIFNFFNNRSKLRMSFNEI